MQSSNSEVIHMSFKIDAMCLYMAYWHAFLGNYSIVAVKGAFKDWLYFLSAEGEIVLGNGLPQAISMDLRWWETGKKVQIHLNFLDKVIPEKLISNFS